MASARAVRQGQAALYAGNHPHRDPHAGRLSTFGLVDSRARRETSEASGQVRGRSSGGAASLSIPPGEPCLAWLERQGIRFRPLKARAGVRTPVAVTGPIGGVDYVTAGGPALVGDCRLVVALHWIAPQLRALGVRRVRHSGAYVYRTTRKGRLSLHALGLAIDLHEFDVAGQKQNVKKNYVVGMQNACHPGAPPLNHLACRLGTTGLFKELITPDHDRDHHDHLHLAIAPL